MPTTVDQLKDIGSTVAEAAKLNLTRSGSLLPVLMLVRDGDVEEIMGMPTMPNETTKYEAYRFMAYRFMAMVLHRKAPDAVIMVNYAYMRVLKKEEAESFMENYDNGSMATDFEAVESIVIAFKGPSIPTSLLAIPYHKNEVGEIVFDSVDALKDWHDGAEMNLLPDWWDV
jgi:hypothetical protein